MKKNLIIVGAGAAGSAAAYLSAKAGLDTLIIEKEKWPRYKACGGALSARTTKILKKHNIELGKDIITKEIDKFKFSFTKKIGYELKYNKTPIKLVNRKYFDDFLLKKALASGAELIDENQVLKIEEFKDNVLIESEKSTYQCKYLIAADGANSKISYYLNPDRKKIKSYKGIAIEAEIERNKLTNDNFEDQILIDFKYLNNGYAWLFPKQKHLSIGIGSMKLKKLNIKEIFYNYLSDLDIEVDENQYLLQAHPIPVYSKKVKIKRGSKRILLAGDAANLADAFIGEGIFYALASGFAAAETVIESNDDKFLISQNYQNKLESTIFSELRAAEKTAGLFYNNQKIVQLILNRRKDLLINVMDAVQGIKSYNELSNLFNFLKMLLKI